MVKSLSFVTSAFFSLFGHLSWMILGIVRVSILLRVKYPQIIPNHPKLTIEGLLNSGYPKISQAKAGCFRAGEIMDIPCFVPWMMEILKTGSPGMVPYGILRDPRKHRSFCGETIVDCGDAQRTWGRFF